MSTSATNSKCPHCGLIHEMTCPKIKAIEYHPNGTVKRVEFFSIGDQLGPVMPAPLPVAPLSPYPITCVTGVTPSWKLLQN
jgi:hypothetical protein